MKNLDYLVFWNHFRDKKNESKIKTRYTPSASVWDRRTYLSPSSIRCVVDF